MNKFRASLIALLLVLVSFLPAKAQDDTVAPDSTNILHVIVLYNRHGVGSGVGSNLPVFIRESGSSKWYTANTDANSSVHFGVYERTYHLAAYPHHMSLFFEWECQGSVLVNQPEMTYILECYERFFIRIPFLVQ